jgi:hypothetical protein
VKYGSIIIFLQAHWKSCAKIEDLMVLDWADLLWADPQTWGCPMRMNARYNNESHNQPNQLRYVSVQKMMYDTTFETRITMDERETFPYAHHQCHRGT